MHLEHLAIWVEDLELIKNFYQTYFNMISGEKYTNEKKNYTAYFVWFANSRTRIELMHKPEITNEPLQRGAMRGIAHFAISLGSKSAVDLLTEQLRTDGYTVAGEPRTTGDGYYESVILDPEGNSIELCE
ncbi:MAG: VOC family protein [Bacteroidaceae bacterium]